jgi:hypothetical protein
VPRTGVDDRHDRRLRPSEPEPIGEALLACVAFAFQESVRQGSPQRPEIGVVKSIVAQKTIPASQKRFRNGLSLQKR